MGQDETDLSALKASLLGGLRFELTPEQGDEAFERHQLLAIRFHRAARLNDRAGDKEWESWCRYFHDHFPRGDEHAKLLWDEWRVSLLKDETPGAGVAITHGQPDSHWQVIPPLGLYINLESMRGDFEDSVSRLTAMLARDPQRREVALSRWRSRLWTVQTARFSVPASYGVSFTVASAMGPPPPESPEE